MEKILEQGLLYDFYGELLTDHQKKIYEDAVFGDLSLSEIAQEAGISRQGVHDLIRRCDRALQEYEAKLHLLERFLETRKKAQEIADLADQALAAEKSPAVSRVKDAPERTEYLEQIRELSRALIEEL